MSDLDQLNESLLATYLEANVEGFKGPITTSKFTGGQSKPTFQVQAALVLRHL